MKELRRPPNKFVISSTFCIRLTLPLGRTVAEAHRVLIACLMCISTSTQICNVSNHMRMCVRLLLVVDFAFILSLGYPPTLRGVLDGFSRRRG